MMDPTLLVSRPAASRLHKGISHLQGVEVEDDIRPPISIRGVHTLDATQTRNPAKNMDGWIVIEFYISKVHGGYRCARK